LHGNLTAGEQNKVFEPAKGNELKIVISTNVAEVSLAFVVYVLAG
jgi:HrpA-like RNA helicase